MKSKSLSVAAAILIVGLFVAPPAAGAQDSPSARSVIPAAKVGDEVIALEEVERALQAELARIERQRNSLLSQKLEQLVEERLLVQEAKRRGITVEQLLNEEVYATAPKVTDDQVTEFISKNRAQLSRGDEAELRLRVWDYLRSQKVKQQRQDYVWTLRVRSKVAVYLEEPARSGTLEQGKRRGFL
ncbi:MAG: SurA N-terminal domain-containing protein [Deltaproteobacteria bacterium]|nr:SurA N-terminal domain-containing protein [Deltaproteobacteria bacterium]